MEHMVEKGPYGWGDVFIFRSPDEAAGHDLPSPWPELVSKFRDIAGKTWVCPGNGAEYTITGLEDNSALCDFYWVLSDTGGHTLYELANSPEFYKNIRQ